VLLGGVGSVFAAGLPGCNLVADLEQFSKVEDQVDGNGGGDGNGDGNGGGDGGPPEDELCGDGATFCAYLTDFGIHHHSNDRMEVNLVTSVAEGVTPHLRARAVFEPIGASDIRFAMPNVIVGDVDVQIWVDYQNHGTFDDAPVDHNWLIRPTPPGEMTGRLLSFENGVLVFRHDTVFDQFAYPPHGLGSSLTAHFENTADFAGATLEFRVTEHASQRNVGLYRTQIYSYGASLKLYHVIDASVPYDIAYYVDVSRTGHYDPGDPAWLIENTELRHDHLTLDLNDPTTDEAESLFPYPRER
jgi:hypothetical protein